MAAAEKVQSFKFQQIITSSFSSMKQ